MVDSADEPPLSNRLHSWAKTTEPSSLNTFRADLNHPTFPNHNSETWPHHVRNSSNPAAGTARTGTNATVTNTVSQNPPVVDKKGDGAQSTAIESAGSESKTSLVSRFLYDVKRIIFSSWVNWLLVFVPVGIALGIMVNWAKLDVISPSVVFAVNAVAIIPLASLLSFATESVASKLGDTIGALLNVTFGNAVELIIFIIALVAKEVRVVQAATLGSILSNLLLILGMCFVAGGLRFREQLYNSAVSQMSACLLCLSVISLLLPSAFHASFNDQAQADKVVLKVSRGTSVVLLFVYVLYLLFQLKSHSFMYASTPQHLIDEESHPGVLAEILNSSSSSSESSSSSDTASDTSSGSHTTAKRIRRALRRKRRKSVSSSKDNASLPSFTRTPSSGPNTQSLIPSARPDDRPTQGDLDQVFSGDEADIDGEVRNGPRRRSPTVAVYSRDFENGTTNSVGEDEKPKKGFRKSRKARRSRKNRDKEKSSSMEEKNKEPALTIQTQKVQFLPEPQEIQVDGASRRAFNIRNISEAMRPAFNSTVFPHHEATGRSLAMPISAVRPAVNQRSNSRGLRRTSSLPDILHPVISNSRAHAMTTSPLQHVAQDTEVPSEVEPANIVNSQEHLSRTSAVVLLLVTTALVALCAEFLVGSIGYLIAHSGVSQAFIGLIILPIIGNAAEHVTAVTVAAKNKMDLAINIALGSSIQIALFVTPLMVILGWIIKTDMSLYFSLFETVSLFASAFIVSFLMIDGRSNYLEGALLIAAYVIIALGAFFYPTCDLSALSGPTEGTSRC